MGSQEAVVEPQHALEPQHVVDVSAVSTRDAASPYFVRMFRLSVESIMRTPTKVVDMLTKKKSGTAGLSDRKPTRLERGHQALGFLERIGVQFIIDPTSLLTVSNDAGVAQHP